MKTIGFCQNINYIQHNDKERQGTRDFALKLELNNPSFGSRIPEKNRDWSCNYAKKIFKVLGRGLAQNKRNQYSYANLCTSGTGAKIYITKSPHYYLDTKV